MFKSKKRPVIVTQAEHGRLSGVLASLWGNKYFDRPAMNFESFVLGVTFHDRGYGMTDNAPIGEADLEEWREIQRLGIINGFNDDPVANIVALMHIKRLLVWMNDAELADLAHQYIRQSLIKTDVPQTAFEWADRITRLCDNISFDFSFEANLQESVEVYSRTKSDDLVMIHHRLTNDGTIYVNPWVFSVESYSGFITGYNAETYPDNLDPVYMPFQLLPDKD